MSTTWSKSMANFTINGTTFSGDNITITNGRVTIDGVTQEQSLSGVVQIKITDGIIGELHSDASVQCGDVRGNVCAGGSVNCDNVGGNVNAGGSINCDNVAGSITAGGSVRCS